MDIFALDKFHFIRYEREFDGHLLTMEWHLYFIKDTGTNLLLL